MGAEKNIMRVVLGVLVCLGTAAAESPSVRPGWPLPESDYVPDEIIVKFNQPVGDTLEQHLAEGKPIGEIHLTESLDSLNSKYKAKNIEHVCKNFKANRARIKSLLEKDPADLSKSERHLVQRLKRAPANAKVPDLGRIYKIEFQSGQSAPHAAGEYNADPSVEYAELNWIISVGWTPNDPNYEPEQWALNNTGQSYPIPGGSTESGTTDCDIDAPEAWEITTGDSNIIVAVIDSGVDYNHSDIDDNIWINPGEDFEPIGVVGPEDFNGVDDDGNGKPDDIRGWPSDPMDEYGHGTHCAGIIAAEGNNGTDITGVCWKTCVMPVRFLNSQGKGSYSGAVEAIQYAVDNGADILSNSWVVPEQAEVMEEVFDYAYSQGAFSIACAGNNPGQVVFPAYYSNVLAVGATDSDDKKYTLGTYGDWVDLAAPGVDILSLRAAGTDAYGDGLHLYPNGDSNATMYIASGTSMACPHAAGVAALCFGVDPNLTLEEIRGLLLNSCDDIEDPEDPDDDNYFGAGRINAYKAVCRLGNVPSSPTGPFPANAATGISINVDLSWTPGFGAFSHDVYFGTDFSDVNDANSSSDEFVGNQTDRTVYQDPLDLNTTYYWRIDEKNNKGTTKGDVWSFTTGSDGGIIYVDRDATGGSNNGTSWEDAYTDLQDALDADFWSGDEIWVAAAEEPYKPDSSERTASFRPRPTARLYGGFAGTETSRDQRDPDLNNNVTILSGDIGIEDDASDNCYHVIEGADYLVLDRFTIQAGNADYKYYPHDEGGGLLNGVATGVIVKGSTFRYNKARNFGGAIRAQVNLTVANSRFHDNSAENGAGVGHSDAGTLSLSNCTFTANSAISEETMGYGGALVSSSADSIITNCLFSANTCTSRGGAIYLEVARANMTNCTLTINNADDKGGAICAAFWSDLELANCILWDNHANSNEEMYNLVSDVNISYCDVRGSNGSGPEWDGALGHDGGGNIDSDPKFVGKGAVSWWKLDEGQGSTAYDSAGDNDGTLYGDAVWTTGRIGDALQFDGNGDYVDCGNDSSLDFSTSDFTIHVWIKTDRADLVAQAIVAKGDPYDEQTGNGWSFYYDAIAQPDRLLLMLNNGTNKVTVHKDTGDLTDGWHLVDVTARRDADAEFFLDGDSLGKEDISDADGGDLGSANVRIARFGDAGSWYFDGKIDDVVLFDRVLTAEEIEHFYEDYHLAPDSPCIDAGDPDGDYDGQTDIDGDPRVMGYDVDMGADEADCFSSGDPNEYNRWVSYGKPNCWCGDCFACGDGSSDCEIDDDDYSILLNAWPPNPYHPCADFNRDGTINAVDVLILRNHWEAGCTGDCSDCTPLP